MRNDVAWMVHDDQLGRAVMLRLSKETAATLARTLNVADLEAPVLDEKAEAKKIGVKKLDAKRVETKKNDVKKDETKKADAKKI